MTEQSDYSSSSEDDEYSDSLEIAASAGARLSTPEKAEYNHVVILIESQYRESDFYDLG